MELSFCQPLFPSSEFVLEIRIAVASRSKIIAFTPDFFPSIPMMVDTQVIGIANSSENLSSF
jgi:hypothetical protein